MAPRMLKEPRPGGGLMLTIDSRVQEVVRYRLLEGMQRHGSVQGFAIVLDPRTGEILAMCNEPSFDPLDQRTIDPQRLKLRCISDQFEPGSTFKITGFSAALESGIVTACASSRADPSTTRRRWASCRPPTRSSSRPTSATA
jgi:cell division protein FtsI (penicillin-binding protein 3)